MTKSIRLISLLCLFAVCNQAKAQSDSLRARSSVFFSPDNILSFADFLWRQNDYPRAIDEYQRYLFSTRVGKRSYACYQLGRCYLRTGNPDRAAGYFAQAAGHATQPAFKDSMRVAHVAALLVADQSEPFLRAIDTIAVHLYSTELQQRLLKLKVLYFLKQKKWGKAIDVLNNASNSGDYKTKPDLFNLALRGQNLPRKSTWAAATLSTLIPGTGKLYAGRISDGLYSLILIGGNAWLAYEGFRDKGVSSFKGWLFGTIGAVFYVGNIYGSVVAVRLYNKSTENTLLNDIQAQIRISTHF
ncbi:MAG: tetratricopeptide repeat protein [Rhodothermales bacterium]